MKNTRLLLLIALFLGWVLSLLIPVPPVVVKSQETDQVVACETEDGRFLPGSKVCQEVLRDGWFEVAWAR